MVAARSRESADERGTPRGRAGVRGRPPERADPRWYAAPRTGAVLVALAAVAVYANTLGNGFVYDDLHQVLEDPRIRGLSGLDDIFGSGVWSFKWGPSSYYRPMMQLSYLLTYQVAGLTPWVFHLVNVLLHAGASLVLYLLALRVLESRPRVSAPDTAAPGGGGAALPGASVSVAPCSVGTAVSGALVAGLVFAVHPLHTEPVAWIAAVGDLELALFGLLTVRLYLRALDGGRSAYGGALGCYALALLSKEPAAAFPAILLAVDLLWSRGGRRSWRGAAIRVAPFVLLAVAYLVVRRLVLGAVAPEGLHGEVGAASAWMTAIQYLGHYLVSCVWPFPLNALYEFRPVLSPSDPRLLPAVLVCGAVVAAVVLLRRDRRVVLAALLFAVPLAPALYVPGLGAGGLAERYVYLPLAGFALAAGIGWMAVLRRSGRGAGSADAGLRLVGVVAAPVLALLLAAAVASAARNTVWKDEETLWADTVRKSPGSAIAHEFLGYGYFAHGKLEEAVAEGRKAIALDPGRSTARINLGGALLALGRYDQAAAEYRGALERGSTMLEARVGLGLALVHLGSYAEARHHLESAVAMDPGYATVHDALGVACANLGDFRAAEAAFAEAVALDPDTPGYAEHLETARRDLARTWGAGGQQP